jgi:hypothetical protein
MNGPGSGAASHNDVEVFQAPSQKKQLDCYILHSIDGSKSGVASHSDVDGQGENVCCLWPPPTLMHLDPVMLTTGFSARLHQSG